MKKLSQIIKEELIPLSSRQQLSLLITIACIFQFVLFFAPSLIDASVKQALAAPAGQTDITIIGDNITKSVLPNPVAAQIINSLATNTQNNFKSKIPSLYPRLKSEVASSTNINSKTLNKRKIKKNTDKIPIKYKVISTSWRRITAYNSEVSQTDNDPCTTANGFNVCKHNQEDTIAANFLPFGTKIKIPSLFGNRVFTVRDRMNKRYNEQIDIWMKQKNQALKFGVKVAKIEIVKID